MLAASERRSAPPAGRDPEQLEAAFRELHGPRLHGFALLLTLGDRATAARLSADALAAGADRVAELAHPERAAAWLRRRVLDGMRRARNSRAEPRERRVATLADLGVGATALAALETLDVRERAALVAASVERLDGRDVGTIVGADGRRLERILRTARRRVIAVPMAPDDRAPVDGPIGARVAAITARTLG